MKWQWVDRRAFCEHIHGILLVVWKGKVHSSARALNASNETANCCAPNILIKAFNYVVVVVVVVPLVSTSEIKSLNGILCIGV